MATSSLLLWTLIIAGFVSISWAQDEESNTVEPRSFGYPASSSLFIPHGGSVEVNSFMSPMLKTGLTVAGVAVILLLLLRWFPVASFARNVAEVGRQVDMDWLADRVDRAVSVYESFQD